MATPSSSATTPSPQLAYMQPHASVAPPIPPTNGSGVVDQEEKDRAVERFIARAEFGKLTRGLRTRLAYASFKATHNVAHNTLHDLENNTQLRSRVTGNRSGNYYNGPTSQGNSGIASGGNTRGANRKGPMGPPASVTASATQSLFATILAPPPAKRARTIHNPQDPPVPAPQKARPASPPRKSSKPTRGGEGSGGKAKGKKSTKSSAKGKGKQQGVHESRGSAADMDIDIQAAATLTSLLLSSRPSISATASSPRSSISAGSDAGSSHSFPHFQQSSARTLTGAPSVRSEPSFSASQPRSGTPASPPDNHTQHDHSQSSNVRDEGRITPKTRRPMYMSDKSGTPHPPTDAEAANSLLFLATSPSPVRASTARDREARDSAAFRALSSGSGLKGRVLFPTHGAGAGGDEAPGSGGRVLRREDTGSFTSTASTASSQFSIGSMAHIYNRHGPNRHMSGSPMNTTPGNSQPVPGEPKPIEPGTPHLLPSASPTRTDRSYASPPPVSPEPRPALLSSGRPSAKKAADTPGNGSFNLSDFIHDSPSPAVATGSAPRLGSVTEIGRKLFEDHHPGKGGAAGAPASGHAGGLAAGIDLSRS